MLRLNLLLYKHQFYIDMITLKANEAEKSRVSYAKGKRGHAHSKNRIYSDMSGKDKLR